MGILEDFGYDEEDNSSYSPDEQSEEGAVLPPTDISARRRSDGDDLVSGIINVAKKIGINPLDLATAISYETGGTFDPRSLGPQTKNGQGRGIGLIQFMSNGSARDYGITRDTSVLDQLEAAGRYLVDRGVKAGMGLLDIYSAINAGRVGLYNRSDANNGGAPGTVRDKVEKQMGGHRLKAAQLLGYQDFDAPTVSTVPQETAYVRPENFIPGDQGRYVPPAQRGPFRAGTRGTLTIGAPDPNIQPDLPVPAAGAPGIPMTANPPINEELAKLLVSNVPPVDEPAVLDESAGLNLSQTVPNINIASQDIPEAVPIPPVEIAPLPPIDKNGRPQVPISGAPDGQGAAAPVDTGSSFMDLLNRAGHATGQVLDDTQTGMRQFAAKAGGAINASPTQLAAAVVAPVAIGGRMLGYEKPAEIVGSMLDYADRGKQTFNTLLGVDDKPATPFQKTASLVGRNFTPMGQSTILATGLMSGAEVASMLMTASPASAQPTMTKEEARKLLFPENQNTYGPRVTHTIMTAGGPAKLPDTTLGLLGIMGAVTLGAIFAPKVVGAIKNSPIGAKMFGLDARAVKNAPTGVLAFSDRVDLMRTYDDKYAGVLRLADRIGVNPAVLNDIQDTFQIQTGGAARNLINSAVTSGEMRTPLFTFKAKVSVVGLAKAETPVIVDYMHTRNIIDEIFQQEAKLAKAPVAVQNAQVGPITVRGMTKQDALNRINALERTNPEVIQFSKDYRDNVTQFRKFLNKGEYATLSTKEYRDLMQTSPNKIFQDLPRENTQVTPLSPSATLEAEMQKAMRVRMENEAIGMYIDGMRKTNPNFSRRVTAKQLEANPNWKANTVQIYRRGKPEYHVMDPFVADVLNMDPYMASGTLSTTMYTAKRVMEATATGVAAPWFATTSALRSYQIGKITTGEGLKPPTIPGMVKAVPMQLYPQLAKNISDVLDKGSAGWLGSVFGPQTLHGMSQSLAKAYDNSFYAMIEHAGTHKGSFLQHHMELNKGLMTAAKDMVPGPAKSFLNGYRSLLDSIHNSASFDFAVKNVDKFVDLPRLSKAARHLTGDPTVAGQYYTRIGANPARKLTPIRFQDSGKLFGFDVPESVSHTATSAAKGYGFLTEMGRDMVPWWNITTQGMKRIGESYVADPAKFVAKAWLYQAMPAAALFLYSRGAGLDPNGQSYSDYQMNRRSEYAKLMNWYIPIPGRPAEDGIEIPRFHELAPMAHMMETAMNHLTQSEQYLNAEDYMKAALSFVGLNYTPPKQPTVIFPAREDMGALGTAFMKAAVLPPMPPVGNALLGAGGIVAPEGPFGGEMYRKKTDPYDQFSGMNTNFELVARALGTGLADVLGEGYLAYTRSDDALSGVKNAASATTRKTIEKTPIARDIIGYKAPASGNTRVTDELFKYQRTIDQLARFFKTNDESMDDQGISIKPRSKSGAEVVNKFLGSGPPESLAAQGQPEPTNPLYKMFISELYDKFKTDATVDQRTGAAKGGIGYQSLMQRYGQYTRNLKALRNVNEGNAVAWDQYLATVPDQMQFLIDNNIDPTDVRTVRNFYERKRQDAARQILFTIRAVEEDFARRLNKPGFRITDLDPYAKMPAPQQGTGTIQLQ